MLDLHEMHIDDKWNTSIYWQVNPENPQFLMYSSNFCSLESFPFLMKLFRTLPWGFVAYNDENTGKKKKKLDGTKMMRINIKRVSKGYLLLNECSHALLCLCHAILVQPRPGDQYALLIKMA